MRLARPVLGSVPICYHVSVILPTYIIIRFVMMFRSSEVPITLPSGSAKRICNIPTIDTTSLFLRRDYQRAWLFVHPCPTADTDLGALYRQYRLIYAGESSCCEIFHRS